MLRQLDTILPENKSTQSITRTQDFTSSSIIKEIATDWEDYFENKKIKKIRISLTNKCNYKCVFCHNEWLSAKWKNRVWDKLNKNFSSSEWIKILAEAAAEMWVNTFSISWGEPFLNKNILDILDAIKAWNPNAEIGITSNWVLITSDMATEIAKRVSKVRVNFQSPKKKNFEMITWVDWLEKIKIIIQNLLTVWIGVCLNMVHLSHNKDDVLEAISFAREYGCDLKILELVKDGPNSNMYENITELSAKLKSLPWFEKTEWHGESEERFYFGLEESNVRLIYSYCNSFDGEACQIHWEVRVTPSMELNHCLVDSTRNISLKEDMVNYDKQGILSKLQEIQKILWACPKEANDFNFQSNHYLSHNNT